LKKISSITDIGFDQKTRTAGRESRESLRGGWRGGGWRREGEADGEILRAVCGEGFREFQREREGGREERREGEEKTSSQVAAGSDLEFLP
jgi:hypothetical protein